MTKKLFILILALVVMIFSTSSAMAATDYETIIGGSDISDPTNVEDFEEREIPETAYAGENYKATYKLPNLILWDHAIEPDEENGEVEWTNIGVGRNAIKYTFSYTISSDNDTISKLTAAPSTSGDEKILTISGTLPETSGEYKFGIIAEITTVSNQDYNDVIGRQYSFNEVGSIVVSPVNLVYKIATPDAYDGEVELSFDVELPVFYITRNYDFTYTIPDLALWRYNAADEDDELHKSSTQNFTLKWSFEGDLGNTFNDVTQDGNILRVSGTAPAVSGDYPVTIKAEIDTISDSNFNNDEAKAAALTLYGETITVNYVSEDYVISGANSPTEEISELTLIDSTPEERRFTGEKFFATYQLPDIAVWKYNAEYPEDDTEGQQKFENVKFDWTLSTDIANLSITLDENTKTLKVQTVEYLPDTEGDYSYSIIVKPNVKSLSGLSETERSKIYQTSLTFPAETITVNLYLPGYKLSSSESPAVDPVIEADEQYTNKSTYVGYNYKMIYKLPKLVWWEYNEADETDEINRKDVKEYSNYAIDWKISPDIEWLNVSIVSNDNGGIMTVTGILPDNVAKYNYRLAAVVSEDSVNADAKELLLQLDESSKTFESEEYTIYLEEDTGHTNLITPTSGDFSSYVVFADTENKLDVTQGYSNYSVLVRAPKDANNLFTVFIQSDDEDAANALDLPDWLTVDKVEYAAESDLDKDSEISMGDFSKTPIKSLLIKIKDGAEVKSGDKAAVHVPFYDKEGNGSFVLGWQVTYKEEEKQEEEPRPFGIFGSKEVNISFSKPETQKPDIIYKNVKPTAAVTNSNFPDDIKIVPEISDLDPETNIGAVYVNVTVPNREAYTEENYSADIVLTAGDTTVTIPLNVGIYFEDAIIADKTEIDLIAGGDAKEIALTLSGFINGVDNWELSYNEDALTVSGPDNSGILTISANSNAQRNTYKVVITASNEEDLIDASITIDVNVKNSEDDTDLEITSVSPSSLTLKAGGSAQSVNLTTNKTQTEISWSVSGTPSGVTPEITKNGGNAAVKFTPSSSAAAGTYTATITAADALGYTASKEITLIIESQGTPAESNFNLSASPASISIVKEEDAQTVNISVSGTPNGSLTWSKSSVSGLEISFTNSSNSSAVVSVKALESATAKTYTVTITAKDTNNTSKNVSFKVIVSDKPLTPEEEYAALIEANAARIKSLFNKSGSGSVAVLDKAALLAGDVEISSFNDLFAEFEPAEVPVIALDAIDGEQIDEAKIYVFPVSYDLIQNAVKNKLLTVGEGLLIHIFADEESEEFEAHLINNSGNEITTVPSSGKAGINVAAALEPLGENYYYWPIISKYKLTGITGDTNPTLEAGETKTVKFTANKNVTSWELTADEDIFSWNISQSSSTANLSLTAASDAEEGDYDASITAYDVDGTSADLSIVVSVTPSTENYLLELSADTASISLTAGGTAKIVTVTADGKFKNNLSWNVQNNGGLNVENSGTPGRTQHRYSISAPSTAAIGSHTVIIEVSDGDVNTKTFNINAVVSASSSTISRDQSSSGDSSTVTDDEEQKRQNFINNSSNVAKTSLKKVSDSLISAANFIAKLAGIASDTAVAALDVDAFSSESRTVTEISESFENEEPILALPVLESGTITEAKIYVFVADIANKIREAINASVITPYSQVFIRVTKLSANSSGIDEADGIVSLSEENSEKGMFLDDEGNEITNALGLLNATNVNVAAYLEPDTDYSFVVTASEEDNTTLGPSNAGCITGSAIGLIAMMLSSGIFKIRRKVKKNS